MRIGTPQPPKTASRPKFPNYPPRPSTDDHTSTNLRKKTSGDVSDEHPLNPEDFTDVFGGPPRTVISGQFSTGFPISSSSFFYEEIFRHPENVSPSTGRIGRSLKEFRIPKKSFHYHHNRQNNGFHTDIFGWDDDRVVRSRSRSKTSSSSMLSSEELSPIRREVSADDYVSLFASKLRNYPFGLSLRNASPKTIRVEPISNSSFRVSTDYLEPNSPASAVSSVCHSDREQNTRAIEEEMLTNDQVEQEEDEVMSSYVIEINSDNREGTSESNGVDEAIAWAKEKFHKHRTESKRGSENCEKRKHVEENLGRCQFSEGHTDSFGSLDEQQEKWALEEEMQPPEIKFQIEMQVMDEKIMLWSKGKKSDIRLLLSSLHHILWPNSGWFPIPQSNIIESSKVKKAYQKARLCLHPDKVQQRGATLPQKYIAEKAFSLLQDAWAAFVSQDIFRR